MRIRSIRHKGLRRLVDQDDDSVFQPVVADKLRKIIFFLQDIVGERELENAALWKAHKLSGDRKGVWSLSVTRNWRLTFRIEQTAIEIVDLDYEDYH